MMRGKISRSELVVVTTLTIVGTVFIEMPRYVTTYAAQSGWICVALAAVPAMALGALVVWLANRFPKLTPIGYAEAVLGRPLGKLISAMMALTFLEGTALLARDFATTIVIVTQPHTNDSVIIGLFMLLLLYMVFWGIEVIARVAIIFLPYIVISPILITVGTLGFLRPGRLLPLLGAGLPRIFGGTYAISTYFGEVVLASMLIPHVRNRGKSAWPVVLSVIAAAPPLIAISASAIGVFGPAETTRLLSPGIELARMVSLGESLQRLEALFVVFWMLAAMIKVGIFSWASAEILSEVIDLKDYRVILPAFFALAFELAMFPETVWDQVALRHALLIGLPAFFYGIPLLVAVVALIRRKRGEATGAES